VTSFHRGVTPEPFLLGQTRGALRVDLVLLVVDERGSHSNLVNQTASHGSIRELNFVHSAMVLTFTIERNTIASLFLSSVSKSQTLPRFGVSSSNT